VSVSGKHDPFKRANLEAIAHPAPFCLAGLDQGDDRSIVVGPMAGKRTLNARNLEALGAPVLAELLIELSSAMP